MSETAPDPLAGPDPRAETVLHAPGFDRAAPPGAAVVLAAGAGTRFARPTSKLLAPVAGGPSVLERAVAAASAAGFAHLFVVVGAVPAEDLPALPDGATVVECARWADGQAASLAAGLAAAADAGAGAATVGLGDQPGLTAAAWRAVAATAATPIAVATYAGRRGHPVRLAAEVWALLPRTGDAGARDLLRDRPDLVTEVPCPGDPADVDTVTDLARWDARLRRGR